MQKSSVEAYKEICASFLQVDRPLLKQALRARAWSPLVCFHATIRDGEQLHAITQLGNPKSIANLTDIRQTIQKIYDLSLGERIDEAHILSHVACSKMLRRRGRAYDTPLDALAALVRQATPRVYFVGGSFYMAVPSVVKNDGGVFVAMHLLQNSRRRRKVAQPPATPADTTFAPPPVIKPPVHLRLVWDKSRMEADQSGV